ncbi:unnamed protein product [Schistosoma mattheei]|uniref:Uncharacterized protein n=1 Tax=Schistosoma mattheei TaxID=31246 RepID=A0A3P8DS67_9TREM|nr:unnamed protein product [Schistosoma mattheei]
MSNVSRVYPSDGSFNASDLDPEAVRLALRDFVQKYSSVKRDYEDAQAQITSLHSRLNEQAEQTEQWARRLHQLQQALCEAEAVKLRDNLWELFQFFEEIQISRPSIKCSHKISMSMNLTSNKHTFIQ